MHPSLSPLDEHNQELLSQVQPAQWENPEPAKSYNLVVIGGGTAGLVSAAGAAGLGAKVALIERSMMGGDCLNYGCVPSKGIIRGATAAADVQNAHEFGIHLAEEPVIDFTAIMARMRKLRAAISHHDSFQRFKDLGIDVFQGEGRFTGRRTIEVDGQQLKFSKAVIATGARASAPPIPGLDNLDYLTNETIFNLTERPARLAVIGAGPIGCEMAQTFRRFGSEVHLIELADQILIKEDPDAAKVVQDQLEKDGATLWLGVEEIVGMEQLDSHKSITIKQKDSNSEETIKVDAVLVAVGRKPNVSNIGLDVAGVDFDERKGITVSDRLQTSNARIYAAGDVCSRYQFTHAADFLARNVLKNALFFGRSKASDLVIPWATYTDPQIAHVGLTKQMATDQGIDIDTYKIEMNDVDRALLDGETEGFVKVHTKKGAGEILGATIVARHSGDMIGELVMAMNHGIGLGEVAQVIHPYPTQAEAIRKVGDLYNKTRLTPRVLNLFKTILKWQR